LFIGTVTGVVCEYGHSPTQASVVQSFARYSLLKTLNTPKNVLQL